MEIFYPAYFTPLEKQHGYCVTVPDLPGCVTQGSSIADALKMAVDAASGWVLDALENGEEIPAPRDVSEFEVEENGGFVKLITLHIQR